MSFHVLCVFSVLFFYVSVFSSSAWGASVDLVLMNDIPTARCLDGSPNGYYYQASSEEDPLTSTRWIIHLNGGGECDAQATCQSATQNSLGSSHYFPSSMDAAYWPLIANDNCQYNPQFCQWHKLYVPYCTQDLHTGQVVNASADTWGFYFAGHISIVAMLDAMDTLYNLTAATEIIVTGESAGGIGVWINVDYIALRYPHARVIALPIAGFYFPATFYAGINATTGNNFADFRVAAIERTSQRWQAFVDQSCAEYYTTHQQQQQSPALCIFANTSFPFIDSESFSVQALTDEVVLTGHDHIPPAWIHEAPELEFIQQWSDNMTLALQPITTSPASAQPRTGVFAAACYTHTSFDIKGPFIDQSNFYEAFVGFYQNSIPPSQYKLIDDCGIFCNPTCLPH